ncbi:hypothetical protein Lfu02_57180 [Longispora fulva]|nr:hypothetical protein Lfu02_57180 [Longispora fulva]
MAAVPNGVAAQVARVLIRSNAMLDGDMTVPPESMGDPPGAGPAGTGVAGVGGLSVPPSGSRPRAGTRTGRLPCAEGHAWRAAGGNRERARLWAASGR